MMVMMATTMMTVMTTMTTTINPAAATGLLYNLVRRFARIQD